MLHFVIIFFNVESNAVTSILGYIRFDYVYLLHGYAFILNNLFTFTLFG